MDASGIAKAAQILASMKDAARRMERAMDKGDSDTVAETKKEVIDLQKQLNAIL